MVFWCSRINKVLELVGMEVGRFSISWNDWELEAERLLLRLGWYVVHHGYEDNFLEAD